MKLSVNEWRTPPEILDRVRAVLGGIDLDPASSVEGNETVRADRFFTVESDGLAQSWAGRNVFLNPPHGWILYEEKRRSGPVTWMAKFERERRGFSEAILLMPLSVGVPWFATIAKADVLALPFDRLAYVDPTGAGRTAPRGDSVLAYYGPAPDTFADAFRDMAWIAEVAPR